MMRFFWVVCVVALLAGCSSLGQSINANVEPVKRSLGLESNLDMVMLAGGSLATVADIDNYGTTHYVITKGVGRIVEDWADAAFPLPEQEGWADAVAIMGTGLAVVYWADREGWPDPGQGDVDKRLDAYLPFVPLGQMIWKRLRYVQ